MAHVAASQHPQQINTNVVPEKKKLNLKSMRDRDREMVKGIFRFYELPGGLMQFSFKKYKEDPIERYDLVDGQIYTLPLGVAKHLNNDCYYVQYGFFKTPEGETISVGHSYANNMAMRVTNKVRRLGFQSLEFVDVDEFNNNISVVETTGSINVPQ